MDQKEFPTHLAEVAADAARFKRVENREGRTVSISLSKELTPDLFDRPSVSSIWFKMTLEKAEEFLQEKIKTGVL